MTTEINEIVSVNLAFDSETKKAFPKWVIWKNHLYPTTKVGLHHTYRSGETLFHVFSIMAKGVFLRLIFNTENLSWNLEEITDNLSV